MGIENNNAIIATTWKDEEIQRLTMWISTLEPTEHDGYKNDPKKLFLIGPPAINNKTTIVLVPDGSKEGWADSDFYDDIRDRFVEVLGEASYEDGSSPWEWVEVGFGEYGQKVLRGNNRNCYNDADYADDKYAEKQTA